MNKTVAVILSTYNGEAFLQEQLDSILNQRNVDITLYVRDDGSTDSTKELLNQYADKYPNIHVEFGNNVGVANSFMNKLYAVPDFFDFYAFADQDDIWNKMKLEHAISLLEESGKLLYGSNQECVDANGNSMGLRYSEDKKIHLSTLEIMTQNNIAGCTMVFTREFYKKLIRAESRPSPQLLKNRIHDVWVAAVASLTDGIVYDKSSYIYYRQHENNVVGAKEKGPLDKTKDRISKIADKNKRNGRSKLAKELINKYPVEAKNISNLEICAYSEKIKNKFELIKKSGEFTLYSGESKLGFALKVLGGYF